MARTYPKPPGYVAPPSRAGLTEADVRRIAREVGGGGGVITETDPVATAAGYQTAANVTSAITAHTSAGDPHPTYTTAAELSTAISGIAPTANASMVTGKRTAGNVTIASTTWTDVDNAINLVVPAVAGNVIMIGTSFRWINPAASATQAFLDAVTMVAGSPVNSVADATTFNTGGNSGVQGWRNLGSTLSADLGVGSTVFYVVQAGDLSGGNVTLQLKSRLFTGTANHLIAGVSNGPFMWWAWNPNK